MAERRLSLEFDRYEQVIADIRGLEEKGYERVGAWSLGQICEHLSFYFRGSLEGFDFKLPWVLRATFGKYALKKALKSKLPHKPGSPTAPPSVYDAGVNEAEAVAGAIALIERLSAARGPLYPSGFYGELTVDQWRHIHLGHAAHHLSFLVPK